MLKILAYLSLDRADHQSHVAFTLANGACPAGFVPIAKVFVVSGLLNLSEWIVLEQNALILISISCVIGNVLHHQRASAFGGDLHVVYW